MGNFSLKALNPEKIFTCGANYTLKKVIFQNFVKKKSQKNLHVGPSEIFEKIEKFYTLAPPEIRA